MQDCDVLDTWFSSSLVPLVLAGWPAKKIDSSYLTLMETGYDILGFWVVRMLTICEQICGHYPFKNIFLHGLIRDNKGRKMSKSLGNVIEPDDIIDGIGIEKMLKRVDQSSLSYSEKNEAKVEIRNHFPNGIQKYGADALRFALLRHDVTSLDIKVDIAEMANEGYRFCNKLWNLCNYALMVFSAESEIAERSCLSTNVADRWLLSRLGSTLRQFDSQMKEFSLSHSATTLQKFFQADLCDFYLETTKSALRMNDQERLRDVASTLRTVLENSFAALSVVMPFVSQYLFDKIKADGTPKLDNFVLQKIEAMIDPDLEKEMNLGISIASTLRSVRSQFKLPLTGHLKVYFVSEESDLRTVRELIESSSNATLIFEDIRSSGNLRYYLPFSVPGHSISLYIALPEDYRVAVRSRLLKQLETVVEKKQKAEKRAEKFQQLCSNENIKPSVLVKNLQRVKQAKTVAESAEKEIKKLNRFLQQFEESVV